MVLKVVTGKILETLELRCSLTACSSLGQEVKTGEKAFAFAMIGRTGQRLLAGRCAPVKLSKNVGYLIDNLDTSILSEVKE
jgi:hypothetical protein